MSERENDEQTIQKKEEITYVINLIYGVNIIKVVSLAKV